VTSKVDQIYSVLHDKLLRRPIQHSKRSYRKWYMVKRKWSNIYM